MNNNYKKLYEWHLKTDVRIRKLSFLVLQQREGSKKQDSGAGRIYLRN